MCLKILSSNSKKSKVIIIKVILVAIMKGGEEPQPR